MPGRRDSHELIFPMLCRACGFGNGYPRAAVPRPGFVDIEVECRECHACWTVSRPEPATAPDDDSTG